MKISEIFNRQASQPSNVPKPFGPATRKKVIAPEESRTEPSTTVDFNTPASGGDLSGVQGYGMTTSPEFTPRYNEEGREIQQGLPVVRTVHHEVGTAPKEHPINLPGLDECNCKDVLPFDMDNISLSNLHALSSDNPIESKRASHHIVLDQILRLMHEPSDEKRVGHLKNFISKIKMNKPSLEGEFKNHIDHHLFNAGLDESYLGFHPSELGEHHVKTQQEAQQAQIQARNPSYYNDENCGVCRQYLDTITSHATKHKEEVKNAIMMGASTTPEDAERATSSIVGDIFSDFNSGGAGRKQKTENLENARKVFNNWNKHLEQTHNDTLATPDLNKNIPVTRLDSQQVAESNGRNPLVHGIYRKLVQRLSPGWNIERREDVPSKSPNFNEQTGDNLFSEDMTEKQREQLSKSMINRGEINTYTLPSKIKPRTIFAPSVPLSDREIGNSGKDIDLETGKSRGISPRDVRTLSDPGGTDKRVTELPWGTIKSIPLQEKFVPGEGGSGLISETRGGYFTKERVFKNIHNYNPAKDPRQVKGEPKGVMPDVHQYLFNRAGVKPETKGMESYNQALSDYETQPTHEFVKSNSCHVESPDSNRVINSSGEKCSEHDEHIINPDGSVSGAIRIPDERKLPKPTLGDRINAQMSYRNSFESALQKVYPNEDRNSAIQKLQNDHSQFVKNNSPNVPRVQARKGNLVSKRFNSKEAHLDPSMALDAAKWLGNQVAQTVTSPLNVAKDYAHDFGTAWDQGKYLSQGDSYTPKGTVTPSLSELGHAAAGVGLAGVAVNKGIQNLKDKLQDRKLNKQIDQAIDVANSHTSAAGSTIQRLSSMLVENKVAALGCLGCGRPKGSKTNECPKEGSVSCKAAIKDKLRLDAGESATGETGGLRNNGTY